jgi:hypothetical protein
MTEIAGATVVHADVPAQGISVQPLSQASLPAKTTAQEDLTTAGQRKINLIWEYTQAVIALLVVVTTMIAGVFSMVRPTVSVGSGLAQVQVPLQIPTIIGVAFGMVTGFYFSRTNHAAIGGTGEKPTEKYLGR